MMRILLAGLLAVSGPVALAVAQPAAPPAGPQVTISLKDRQARAVPARQGFTHTGGGNIDVAQPSADTVIVTMAGVAVAGAHPCKDSVAALDFDLEQTLEVAIADPKVKKAKVSRLRSASRAGDRKTAGSPAFFHRLAVGAGTPVSGATFRMIWNPKSFFAAPWNGSQ